MPVGAKVIKKKVFDGLFWAQKNIDPKYIWHHDLGEEQSARLNYGFVDTSLGLFLAIFTEAGLCWFEPVKKAELSEAFHVFTAAADPVHDDNAVISRLQKSISQGCVPLHLTGTTFQLTVWHALLQTRPGDVVNYAALSERIARPGAAQAVGSAAGANRIALFVPCHRVLPASGGVGGYRWGAGLKKHLLNSEEKFVTAQMKVA